MVCHISGRYNHSSLGLLLWLSCYSVFTLYLLIYSLADKASNWGLVVWNTIVPRSKGRCAYGSSGSSASQTTLRIFQTHHSARALYSVNLTYSKAGIAILRYPTLARYRQWRKNDGNLLQATSSVTSKVFTHGLLYGSYFYLILLHQFSEKKN